MADTPRQFGDVQVEHGVQIQLSRHDKSKPRTCWINVDGVCQLRLILPAGATFEATVGGKPGTTLPEEPRDELQPARLRGLIPKGD